MSLIIVESPTKARTFNRILKGGDYYVFATMGHFRDLPVKSMSIDYKKKFKPDYQIIANKTKIVTALKDLSKKNKEIILATDPDREGEAISYHAAYILGFIKENWPDFTVNTENRLKRIVFHEITSKALNDALASPLTLRNDLVKAQQARRILDRVVGYELSPLLWKKMGKNWLSAGRVQTVCLRLIVERQKEINKFSKEPYYQLYGNFQYSISNVQVKAKLVSKNDIAYEIKTKISLFDGEYTFTKTTIDEKIAEGIQTDLKGDQFSISDIVETEVTRFPPPPFTTSLLQQEGFRRHGFSSKQTMKLAQDLYERGLITYHRTDSFQMSTGFVFKAKDYIEKTYGKEYALEKPRGFRTKSKSAQEAHEAIRPTSLEKDPGEIKKSKLTHNHSSLYKLIFDRAVSTQMKEAKIKQIKVKIKSSSGYMFESDSQQIVFDGFLKVLNPEFVNKNIAPLAIKKDEKINLLSADLDKLDTKPPPRYNEASLIKAMEEEGIGRPSTYASIISLIQSKYYVEKEFRYFIPTKLGETISNYLSSAFPQLFDLDFTAKMEDNLDQVAEGKIDFIKLLKDFYATFDKELIEKKKDTAVIDVEEKIESKCEKCGGDLVMRFSRFGKFYGCKNYPKCKFIKPFLYFVKDRFCPDCKGRIVTRFSKNRKKFYGCENWPKCKYTAWKLPVKS